MARARENSQQPDTPGAPGANPAPTSPCHPWPRVGCARCDGLICSFCPRGVYLCMAKYYFTCDISGLAIAPFTGRHCPRKAIHTAMKPRALLQRLKTNPAHPAPIQHLQALAIPGPASGAPSATGLSGVFSSGVFPLLHRIWRVVCP